MKVKLSGFTNIIKGESYLVHNTLAKGLIKVNNNKMKQVIDVLDEANSIELDSGNEFLFSLNDLGNVVEDGVDEIANLNSLYYEFEKNSELSIILMVTRRCNFRCAYCYEEYANKGISDSVFENVKKHILQRIVSENFKTVFISFFGGEPTLKAAEINVFMKDLLLKNAKLQQLYMA